MLDLEVGTLRISRSLVKPRDVIASLIRVPDVTSVLVYDNAVGCGTQRRWPVELERSALGIQLSYFVVVISGKPYVIVTINGYSSGHRDGGKYSFASAVASTLTSMSHTGYIGPQIFALRILCNVVGRSPGVGIVSWDVCSHSIAALSGYLAGSENLYDLNFRSSVLNSSI